MPFSPAFAGLALAAGFPAGDIPPGVRLMRVSLADGQPAPGDPSAIWEAFKPGTEPTGYDYRVVDGMTRFRPGGAPAPQGEEPVDPNAMMPPAWSVDPSADSGDPALLPGVIPPPPRKRPTLTGTGETY